MLKGNRATWTRALLRVLEREKFSDKAGQLKSAIQDLLDEGFENTSVGTIALALDRLDSDTTATIRGEDFVG